MWTAACPARTAGGTRDALWCLCCFSPSLSCSVPFGYVVRSHRHTHLNRNRDEESHLRHREGRCASKEGVEEEPYKDRKWSGGQFQGNQHTGVGGAGLQVIHTLTRRGLYHSGFSSSSKHLSHSLGLWLSLSTCILITTHIHKFFSESSKSQLYLILLYP